MKIISIKGYSKTGKTTTCTAVIRELVNRGYSVGSVKDIHFEGFTLDDENEDTGKHRKAGAATVTALGVCETDIMYNERLDINDILKHYSEDFVVCEGGAYKDGFNIVTGKTTKQLDDRRDEKTICFSGLIAEEITEYDGLPVINALTDIGRLVDIIEENATEYTGA
ncbi:MAG: molybdopterin-guanine dinucleotide biosynthesis protein MobB [Firmicutes bacterium]|nr:molybdopterin-guanine dinucleotide biosynthesis protein MobB [Bacillota bacterium]